MSLFSEENISFVLSWCWPASEVVASNFLQLHRRCVELSQSSILFLIKAPHMIEADGDMQRFAQPCPDVCSFIAVLLASILASWILVLPCTSCKVLCVCLKNQSIYLNTDGWTITEWPAGVTVEEKKLTHSEFGLLSVDVFGLGLVPFPPVVTGEGWASTSLGWCVFFAFYSVCFFLLPAVKAA